MHKPIKSRWKIARRAFRPPTVLAESRLNEFTTQPGGSGETSGLTYEIRASIHDCNSGTYKSTESIEGRRPAWKHYITQMTDTAFSSRLAVYNPFNATQLQKTSERKTRVICFASFHWQRAKRCPQGWITTSWQLFYTMLHTLHYCISYIHGNTLQTGNLVWGLPLFTQPSTKNWLCRGRKAQ